MYTNTSFKNPWINTTSQGTGFWKSVVQEGRTNWEQDKHGGSPGLAAGPSWAGAGFLSQSPVFWRCSIKDWWMKKLKSSCGVEVRGRLEHNNPRIKSVFLYNFYKMDFDYLVERLESSWWKTMMFSFCWTLTNIVQCNPFYILTPSMLWFL